MAKKKAKTRPAEVRKKPAKKHAAAGPGPDLNFGRRNMALLGAAVLCILAGYVSLAAGSITLAPILLVLGYCVLVPYGLATTQSAGQPTGGE